MMMLFRAGCKNILHHSGICHYTEENMDYDEMKNDERIREVNKEAVDLIDSAIA